MKTNAGLGQFVFERPDAAPLESCLYQEHLKLTDKSHIAEFAGYLMPLWYSSVSSEHKAVRQAVGVFDCTHMGVLEIAGRQAARFLNCITTNEVNNLSSGAAQYSYMLDAAGNVLDDIIVYKRGEGKFMVVVNAANEPKIKAWLEALQNDKAVTDVEQPGRRLEYKPEICDMRNCKGSGNGRVDIALQGPASTDVLFELISNRLLREQIENLKPFRLVEGPVAGIDCIISRTGYTGAKVGFELFVQPEQAAKLWAKILGKGKRLGVEPCGLGARDSLRIEAGLPLYGHELAGRFDISPFEAGYGWAVKLEKEFFIGKAAMEQRAAKYEMKVARIELPGQKGVRPVRQNDGVLNEAGRCVGFILSCAKVEDKQIGLVYVSGQIAQEGRQVGIYYLARNKRQVEQGKSESIEKGQVLEADISGVVVKRFEKF